MIAMHTSLDEATVRSGFADYDVFLAKPCNARVLGQCVDQMIRDRRRRAVEQIS